MITYLQHWLDAYLVHLGCWISYTIGITILKEGLPKYSELNELLKSALAISIILSLFSSHSHIHYLNNLLK